MFKRIVFLCLAFLMLMTIMAGPIMTTVNAAEEELENQWTLVRFTWEEETPNHNTWKHMEYALVGSGNGEAAFEELSPYYTVYRYRFMNMINQLKNQAIKQSDNVTLVEINAEPTAVSIKTTVETEDDGDVSFTSVVFNDTEVANLEGDTAFVVVSWAMDEDTAKPEGENDLYLYHRDGCMDGEGAKREVCPYCGLITVHEVLFCGHRSCIRARHEVAGCGYRGHLACRGFHNRAECGTSGHYVCVGDHEEAVCGVKKHYNCDGEDHTACPGCGVLRCSSTYVAANHAVAACGHYICGSGYTAADHEKTDCGHYECMENFDAAEHAAADCGNHYVCAAGYDAANHGGCSACGGYFCDGEDHEH